VMICLTVVVTTSQTLATKSATASGPTVRQVAASGMYNCYLGGYGQGDRLMNPANWTLTSPEKVNGSYTLWANTTYGPFFIAVKPNGKDTAILKPLDFKSAKIWTKIKCPASKSIKVWYSYAIALFGSANTGHYEQRCGWVETLGGGDQYGMDGNGHISTIKKWVCKNVWVTG